MAGCMLFLMINVSPLFQRVSHREFQALEIVSVSIGLVGIHANSGQTRFDWTLYKYCKLKVIPGLASILLYIVILIVVFDDDMTWLRYLLISTYTLRKISTITQSLRNRVDVTLLGQFDKGYRCIQSTHFV